MKNAACKLLSIAALALIGVSAHAQTSPVKDVVLDAKGKDPLPYVIDSRGVISRSGTGLCVRTGFWTKELAAKTPVVGGGLPAGCYCDKELMAKELCEPVVIAAEKAAPAAVVVKTNEKISIAADALFDFDKAVLRPEGKAKLDDVASKAGALKVEAIIVVGHTDRIGKAEYNQKLSERRAAAVKDYLVTKGVAADRIYSEGKGSTQPVTGADECKGPKSKKVIACLQPDRRVNIEIVGNK